MNLSNCRKCNKCGVVYDISSFSNMLGNGELAYSKIEIYGDKYDLCPKCTEEIYKIIKSKSGKSDV